MHRLFAATLALALFLGVGRVALAAEVAESAPSEQVPDSARFRRHISGWSERSRSTA